MLFARICTNVSNGADECIGRSLYIMCSYTGRIDRSVIISLFRQLYRFFRCIRSDRSCFTIWFVCRMQSWYKYIIATDYNRASKKIKKKRKKKRERNRQTGRLRATKRDRDSDRERQRGSGRGRGRGRENGIKKNEKTLCSIFCQMNFVFALR